MGNSIYTAGAIYITLNFVAVLVCLVAAILVFGKGLYKKVVYRLGLYQVLASLALATTNIFETLPFISYDTNPTLYDRLCKAIAWFGFHSQWMKLIFTMWVVFHLFCFAVFHKNWKKLEVLYVVTSLLLPAVIAMVPLATGTYVYSISTKQCYINAPNGTIAFIENVVLWDAPAVVVLSLSSTAMIVVIIKLARTVCLRSKQEKITEGDQFLRALKQLIPLAAFPLFFFIFFIPGFVYNVDKFLSSSAEPPNMPLLFIISVSIPMWSMTSGMTLIAHLCVAKYLEKRRMCTFHLRLREPLFHRSMRMNSNAT